MFRATFLTHLRAVDPDAAVSGTGTMRQYLDAWLGPRRFNLGLFGAFALTAVLLAVSGLYGLVCVRRQSARAGDWAAHGDRRHPARRASHDPSPGCRAWHRAEPWLAWAWPAPLRPLISGMVQRVSISPGGGGRNRGAPVGGRALGRMAARAPRGPDRTDGGAQWTVTYHPHAATHPHHLDGVARLREREFPTGGRPS